MPTPKSKTVAEIPILDLARQYAAIREEILEAVERVCASQRYILGDEVVAFEREFSALCGTSHVVACSSGTDALWLALAAAGIQGGDAVITTPFTFFATASSVVRVGARPFFTDIDPETLNLDADSLEEDLKACPARRHAVIAVDLYGQCADGDRLSQIAAEFKLKLIEDAAQAAGARWNGRPAGSFGDVATFSFYPTKNLSAFGDAGAIATNDPALAEHARSLRNHGAKQRYYHDEFGWNSRMDAIQAAVLRVKMPYLRQWNEARRDRARVYERLLTDAGLTRTGAESSAPVLLLKTRPEAHHIYHQYVIRARNRDKLREFLKDRGVGSEIYYPVPLHLQQCFSYLGYAAGSLPEAERAATEVLALPMFAELEEDEQRHVVNSIAQFYS